MLPPFKGPCQPAAVMVKPTSTSPPPPPTTHFTSVSGDQSYLYQIWVGPRLPRLERERTTGTDLRARTTDDHGTTTTPLGPGEGLDVSPLSNLRWQVRGPECAPHHPHGTHGLRLAARRLGDSSLCRCRWPLVHRGSADWLGEKAGLDQDDLVVSGLLVPPPNDGAAAAGAAPLPQRAPTPGAEEDGSAVGTGTTRRCPPPAPSRREQGGRRLGSLGRGGDPVEPGRTLDYLKHEER
ncbi:hypothetical protein THAOC_19085, partial [Thalassiosira oceanica]